MTKMALTSFSRMSRCSPPLSADVVAVLALSPMWSLPPISDPFANDEAPLVLPTSDRTPRRRHPSSEGAKASCRLTPNVLVPKLPSEPSSACASGPHRRANLNGCATPQAEPSSDDEVATSPMSPSFGLPTSSEPNVTETAAFQRVPPHCRLPTAFGHTINAIREHYRQRDDLLRAEGNMTRQVKAICRRAVDLRFDDAGKVRASKMSAADALFESLQSGELSADTAMKVGSTLPLLEARKSIGAACLKVETQLVKLVKTLPVYESFVLKVNGFGPLGLGQIIGTCGDLNLYANPAKVWKRMGLGLVGGERQRKHLDAAKALEHGYSPRRRSTMYVIGASLWKQQGPYRDLYLARKDFEAAKATAADIQIVKAADTKPAAGAKTMSQMHIHRRAQRYMEKRLLRDLWRAWTGRGTQHPTEKA